MNVRIAKLETLLTRIQARAEAPRPSTTAEAASATEEIEPLQLDSPSVIPPPSDPIAAAAPELDEPGDEAVDSMDLEELEPAPESGPVASNVEGALSQAAGAAPITPPPESVEEQVSARAPSAKPTMEQLGQTVDLDEIDGESTLELDEPTIETDQKAVEPGSDAAPTAPGYVPSQPEQPLVAERPKSSAQAVELQGGAKTHPEKSFLELIDSSLKL